MKKYSTHRVMSKQSVQGATLVEVLVSVLLLTVGILGLMSAQLRSVSAVSESENRSIAAQAAENLAEAMQTNPRITDKGKRDYADYLQSGMQEAASPSSCNNSTYPIAANSKNPCQIGSNRISKQELANIHLGEFQYILQQMPNATNIKYTVCLDKADGRIRDATLTNANCDTGGGMPTIKIVWSTLKDKSSNDDGIPTTETQSYYLVVPQ